MTTQPEFGFAQLITELLRGLADAAADRPAETDAQRFARHQTVIFSVMAFLPRDALETMVAGQCVMFDHLLRDATRDLLRSEAEPVKRRIRSQVTALGRSFLKHLEELRGLQARRGQQAAASPSGEAAAPPEPDWQSVATAADQPASAMAEALAPVRSSQPASSAAPEAAAQPQPTPSGKADLLLQRGFQNRRMRRASQFRKPASGMKTAASQGCAAPAVAPQAPPGTPARAALPVIPQPSSNSVA